MRNISEYRDKGKIKAVVEKISAISRKKVRLMEVCGTHTMNIARYAIRSLLPKNIELLSGPGCPVCVTSVGELEKAFQVARREDMIVCTFGDMMKVPGKSGALTDFKNVKIVYSPFDALEIAKKNPEKEIVFLGVGFETTIPVIGAAIIQAKNDGVKNFSVLAMFKLIPPALAALLSARNKNSPQTIRPPHPYPLPPRERGSTGAKIDGLICPGHVSTIIGSKAYEFVAREYKLPCVVTGFEPLDIVQGIAALVGQLEKGESRVEAQYDRAVTPDGNRKAKGVIEEVYEPCDANWRGIGVIPGSGLKIREKFSDFDAEKCFNLKEVGWEEPKGCLCGMILQGLKVPKECGLFAKKCTPENPVGPCMVSSEGACSAYYKYGQEMLNSKY